jgi:23S rRNA pseudouridine2605 synthase
MAKAKKQGTGNSEQEIEEAVVLEVKPKTAARKKKAAEPTEHAEVEAAAKPAKKAAKKTAKAVEAPEPAVEVAETSVEPEKPIAKKAPSKKAAAKKSSPKKATVKKGRDLVVDEPGAAEVAEVLHQEPPSDNVSEEDDDEPALPVRSESRKQTKGEDQPEIARPELKLERLQKILAKAGISSRRKAEELILGGQVQINGKIVTELGTKADAERDHVRVDGKLLQGPERIRYFVLNKPKGYVTTVSDPENRPTVMQFFSSERERLYPVGRLDYLSEGLLLVTNDGELANKLTKASSGVEKTYLVKVAGHPTEDMLDVLRAGVVIEKGRPGTYSGRVRTAPAQIRQVRQGDNPWYEVIIIEGRNRELRKMFEEIGHHVEKIRRVGYGPLVLDLEPGKSRELEAEEVHALRLASEGKLKTRRRRGPQAAQLPTVAGKTVRYKKADGKPGYEPRRPSVRPEFQTESKAEPRPEFRKEIKAGFKREPKEGFKSALKPGFRSEFKPKFQSDAKPGYSKPGFSKPSFSKPGFSKPGFAAGRKPGFESGRDSGREPSRGQGEKPEFRSSARPPFKPAAGKFGGKPEFRSGPPSSGATSRPSAGNSSAGTSGFGGRRDFAGKPRRVEPPVTEYVLPPRKPLPPESDLPPAKGEFNPDYKPGFRTGAKTGGKPGARPAFRQDGPPKRFGGDRSGSGDKPFKSAGPRRDFVRPAAEDDDWVPTKTPGFKIEPVEDKPRAPRFDRPSSGGRPFRPRTDGPPSGAGARPFRPDSRPSRPAAGGGEFKPRGEFKPAGARTQRFAPRPDGPRTTGPRTTGPRADGPRSERPAFGSPKKFGGPKPFGSPKPFGGAGRSRSAESASAGSDGAPKKKERWRDSFTGKNKGRPKPKPKSE